MFLFSKNPPEKCAPHLPSASFRGGKKLGWCIDLLLIVQFSLRWDQSQRWKGETESKCTLLVHLIHVWSHSWQSCIATHPTHPFQMWYKTSFTTRWSMIFCKIRLCNFASLRQFINWLLILTKQILEPKLQLQSDLRQYACKVGGHVLSWGCKYQWFGWNETKQTKWLVETLSSEVVYAKHGGVQIAKHASDALVSVRLVATWNWARVIVHWKWARDYAIKRQRISL